MAASPALARKGTWRGSCADLVELMRAHQWMKNGFVFVGLIFGHAWTDPGMILAAVLAAAGFSLAASAIYIINDFADLPRERAHPVMRQRPLASGRVSAHAARVLCALLLGGAVVLAWLASPGVLVIVAAYVAMNVAYSHALKHIVVLDVFVIAAGFILRILAGTLGIGIAPSQWLLVCSLLLTLFLGFAKRRAELIKSARSGVTAHRKTLALYSAELLDKYIGICAGGAIVAYSLYAMSPETARLHGTQHLVYTVPFVVYGIFRYLYLLHAAQAGTDTSRDLARDRHLIICVLGWLAATLVLIA